MNVLSQYMPLYEIEQVNTARRVLLDAYRTSDPGPQAIGYWLCHKVVALASFPLNIGAMGSTFALAGVSACTIGVFKVCVFAATLGNIRRDDILTYIPDLTSYAWKSFLELTTTVGELARVIIDIPVEGVQFLHFVVWRIEQGLNNAMRVEPNPFEFSTPALGSLNELCDKYRVKVDAEDRPIRKIVPHYLLSMATIPLNTVASVTALANALFLSTVFVAKVVLFASTRIFIPFPTYAPIAFVASYKHAMHVVTDVFHDVVDCPVLVYKFFEALDLTQVYVKAMEVIRYIPSVLNDEYKPCVTTENK